MQDRVSLYPGRVKLEPVAGQANTYDLTRADQPTQEGTPLNKASLLKDATAALYGLPNTAVPDDVLSKIKTLINSANANANTKARIATGSYIGTGTYGNSHPNSLTFEFEPKLVIISGEYLTIGYGSTITQPEWKLWIGQPNAYVGYNNGNVKDTYKVEGNKFSWYNSDYGSASMQLNYSGATYYYIAIG